MPKGDREILKADIEDGYTKLSNLLLEALAMANLSGIQKGICLYIIRKTYSWGKKSEKISLAEFSQSCCIHKDVAWRNIRELLDLNVITLIGGAKGVKSEYSINTRISKWDKSCIRGQLYTGQTIDHPNYRLASLQSIDQPIYSEYTGQSIVAPSEVTQDKHLQTPKETIKELTKENNIVTPDRAVSDDVEKIFEFYRETLGVKRRLTKQRKAKITARLKEFSVEELKQALINLAADDFIMGRGEGGKFYAELEYVFRTIEKTEHWINRNPPRKSIISLPTNHIADKYADVFDEHYHNANKGGYS